MDSGIKRGHLVQKSSDGITDSWLKWGHNQLQSSRNPRRGRNQIHRWADAQPGRKTF